MALDGPDFEDEKTPPPPPVTDPYGGDLSDIARQRKSQERKRANRSTFRIDPAMKPSTTGTGLSNPYSDL